MITVGTLAKLSKGHPVLKNISIEQISTFIRIAAQLKRNILLVQPLEESNPDLPPRVLSDSLSRFLGLAVGVDPETSDLLWECLREEVWCTADHKVAPVSKKDLEIFKQHGWQLGITSLTFYPPNHTCDNPDCPNYGCFIKKEEARQVIAYTFANGALPAYNVHLYCPECQTNYHYNYYVRKGTRTYHGEELPEFLQVGEHQFVEGKVVEMWTSQMLLGWFSASNASRLYSRVFEGDYLFDSGWAFKTKLTTNHVWDSFVIWALLNDHLAQNTILSIPHVGDQDQRFLGAMEARNRRIILYGQPGTVKHCCDRCVRVLFNSTGTVTKICRVIVGDGLSIGRPCCAVPRCQEPLPSTHRRFCQLHHAQEMVCAIKGCSAPAVIRSKVCGDADHQAIEHKRTARGQASFQFKQQLKDAQLSWPEAFVSADVTASRSGLAVDDTDEWYEIRNGRVEAFQDNPGSIGVADPPIFEAPHASQSPFPCPSKPESGNQKIRAQFGRQRTHNEQTLVYPCGLIYARATMYNAEAVSNFLVMVKQAFSVPGATKPNYIIYDSNCDAMQQVLSRHDSWFDGIGMPVDVWHFRNKHKLDHQFCQVHCNPAQFPELMDNDGKWFFNTSVAEQINGWLGGYQSICREMVPAKYDFFLDEMIRLHNLDVLERLQEGGYNPREL